jgi:hypothetical protein
MLRKNAALAVALLLAVQPVFAFKPNDAGHLGITSEVLGSVERTVQGETLKFSQRAIKQIRDANKDTDCVSCQGDATLHFDDEAFGGATNRLIQLRQSVISKITADKPNGESARKDLGAALHTLQDFYAHSTWVELGSGSIDSRLGRSSFSGLAASVATCPSNSSTLGGAGLTSLTSGWFKIPLCDPPAGKCRHGVDFVCPSGLNKDGPGRTGYSTARSLAVEATSDFVDQILNAPGVAGNAKAIKALMDIKGTLAVVIDDTGSMGTSINQVKAQVAQIVNSVAGTDDAPEEYLLVRFGDPDVGSPFVTQDAAAFLAAVNALSPGGGGDCPELSESGQLKAIGASKTVSNLFLFTDASAKDASLAGSVNAAAQAKQIQLTPFVTGSCSPIDPAYIRNAEETGGQLFFLRPSEVGLAFDLVRPQLSGDFATLVLVRDTLPAGGSRDVAVPVDSTVSRVVFSVSIDVKGSIFLVRPSGAPVVAGEPGTRITDLSTGRIFTIENPTPGTWRLGVSGSGELSVRAQGNTPLQFGTFDFVELTGRPDHQGLFRIAGQPIAGTDPKGLASLFGPYSTAEFRLLDRTGAVLGSLDLRKGDPDAAAEDYTGTFALPTEPFRIGVSGLDEAGLPYERLFPPLFRAQTVEVESTSDILSLPPGMTTTLSFQVRNAGPAATFRVNAVDDRGFVGNIRPSVVTLGTGESATFQADARVPTGTAEGTQVSITATAVHQADPEVFNSAALTLPVGVDNRPPDCAGAPVSEVALWPPNHKMASYDVVQVTGITDPDGDPVTASVDAITQDEPVNSTGDGSTSPDGAGIGSGMAQVRAERDGSGNGRVYAVSYTARDGRGGQCQGALRIAVSLSQNGAPAVDDGQTYDSTHP